MSKRAYKTVAQRKKEGFRSNSMPKHGDLIEPQFPTREPPKPDYLDDEGSKFWDFICPILIKHGVVKQTDGDILVCVCMTRSRLIEVYNKLNDTDMEQSERETFLKREDTLQKRFRMELKELGLTPIGRIGIGIGEQKLGGDDL
jgi:P27 family predicted phage terminase small subunit